MPLLSRNKSLPGSATGQSAAATANSKQQPLVCESPLFGIRRQLPVSCVTSGQAQQTRQQDQRQTVSAKNSSSSQSSSSSAALRQRYQQATSDLYSSSSSASSSSCATNTTSTSTTTTTADTTTLVSIPKQITRQQIHYAFSIMDTNSDGLIDLRDLSQMLANLGVPIDEAILSHVMSTVSKRGDHRISEQEFLHWIGNFIQVSDLLAPDEGAAIRQQQQQARLAAGGKRPAGPNEPAASGQRRTHSAVARSSSTSAPSSSASSLVAQSVEAQQLVNQQMRQRRGSGSGLALMRSLSSQSSSPSTGSSATSATDGQHHQVFKTDANQQRGTGQDSSSGGGNQSQDDNQQQRQQQAELQQEARDDLKAAFCVFDLDGDGYITIDEVQQGLKLLGESWSQAELNQLLFSKCDPNNSTAAGKGTASGSIKAGKSSGKRMDLSMAKQPQQQRISIEDFVKLLL